MKPFVIGDSQLDLLVAYLQLMHPNEYVVIVHDIEMDSDVEEKVASKMSEVTGISLDDIKLGIAFNNMCIVSFGDDVKRAREVYEEFPQSEYPYTTLFGPLGESCHKLWLDLNNQSLLAKIQIERGMILNENT
jgi:hypothetical protein